MILRKRFARRAFTLVELLVAMALITLIMSILSQAFVEGLESFRHLKATGDLQENLRTAAIPIRTDLISRHFDKDDKLSTMPTRPTAGFFRLEGMQAPVQEGLDANAMPSFRTDPQADPRAAHAMHMTVRRVGARREDFFAGTLPANAPQGLSQSGFAANFGEAPNPNAGLPGSYLSLEAEVSYFLVRQNDATGQPMHANPLLPSFTPLYSLHRREKLLVKEDLQTAPVADAASYRDLSWRQSLTAAQIEFNRLEDVATVANIGRRGLAQNGNIDRTPPSGTDTLLIPDVLSMTIEVMSGDSFEFRPVHQAFVDRQVPLVVGQPPVTIPAGLYDTALLPDVANSVLPASQRIKAIKVTIRVWDHKTEMARQVSIIQDL